MNVLAIIPARGGSKGIPRKNLELLHGKPLVVHAIDTAIKSSSVTRTVLSTDDDEIAQTGLEAGAEVIKRPENLANDTAPTIPVLQHVVDTLKAEGWKADIIVLLEPTSPFRTPEIVDKIISKFQDQKVKSAITVTQLERNPYNIFSVDGDDAERFIVSSSGQFTRRQQFTHLKRLNGCVYAARESLLATGILVEEPMKVVEMTAEQSINIDTPMDLEIARMMVNKIK